MSDYSNENKKILSLLRFWTRGELTDQELTAKVKEIKLSERNRIHEGNHHHQTHARR